MLNRPDEQSICSPCLTPVYHVTTVDRSSLYVHIYILQLSFSNLFLSVVKGIIVVAGSTPRSVHGEHNIICKVSLLGGKLRKSAYSVANFYSMANSQSQLTWWQTHKVSLLCGKLTLDISRGLRRVSRIQLRLWEYKRFLSDTRISK